MSRLFKAVKAGMMGTMSASGPGRFAAGGQIVSCGHCGGAEFVGREAQLNTWRLTMLDLDWMNRTGTALICTHCGLISWFAKEPSRIQE